MLDPANDNTWLVGTTIHFRGITVDLDETGITSPVTKDMPVTYEGFRLEKGDSYYFLAFGEFEGELIMIMRVLRFASLITPGTQLPMIEI